MVTVIREGTPDYYLEGLKNFPGKVYDGIIDSLYCKDESAFQSSLEEVKKFIQTYFQRLAEWNERNLAPKEARMDKKFFAAVDCAPSSICGIAKLLFSMGGFWVCNCCSFDIKNMLSRALWFKNHPCHKRCKDLLDQLRLPLEERGPGVAGNGLYHLLAMYFQEIPDCILDQRYLKGSYIFQQGRTEQETLVSWEKGLQELYEKASAPKGPKGSREIEDVNKEIFDRGIEYIKRRRDALRTGK